MKTSLTTVSYGPDLPRCQRLNDSFQRYVASDIDHVIVVPNRDMKLFAPIGERPRTRLVVAESILPRWIRRVPIINKWWLARGYPVRGWIMQQITKLSLSEAVDSDVMVLADSDVAFIRPFSTDQIMHDGKVRLHRIEGGGITLANGEPNVKNRLWHRKAGELLGIPVQDYYGGDYIGQVMPWRRDNLIKLHERLESVNNTEWHWLLCRTLHFVEGVIYGVFAEHVLKEDSGHYLDTQDLCHCSWHHVLDSPEKVANFLQSAPPHCVAVLVQSNLGFDVRSYDKALRELWDRDQATHEPAALDIP